MAGAQGSDDALEELVGQVLTVGGSADATGHPPLAVRSHWLQLGIECRSPGGVIFERGIPCSPLTRASAELRQAASRVYRQMELERAATRVDVE